MSNERSSIEAAQRHLAAGNWQAAREAVAPFLSERKPQADALLIAGIVEIEHGTLEEGLKHLEAARARNAAHGGVALNLGIAYRRLGRHQDAVRVMREAAVKGARDLALFVNLIQSQVASGDLSAAERMLQRAFDMAPHEGALLLLKAKLLRAQARFAEAETVARHGASMFPGAPDFEVEIAALEIARDECEKATVRLDLVLHRDPGFVPALMTALVGHYRLKNFDRVFELRARLPENDPETVAIDDNLLGAEMTACEWARAEERFAAQKREFGAPIEPFLAVHMADDPAMVLKAADRFAARLPPRHGRRAAKAREGGRIRVGYLSSDFRYHAVGFLMQDLIRLHDRSRFDVIGISTWPGDDSDIRRTYELTFDSFIDLIGLTADEAIAKVREADLDILVDLNGHTSGRAGLIIGAYPAPVQVTWLGYPGTFGGKVFDYAIADAYTVPDVAMPQFSEAVVRLPDTYQPNTPREAAPGAATRAEFGLPDDAVVFCSFNDPRKIGRAVVESWARILARVPASHFWFYAGNRLAEKNIAAGLVAGGVAKERIHVAPALPLDRHFRRLPVADLFLDTFPYSGHTTCSDALAMGLPVLTLPGKGMGSRVAASLVTLHGFPELVATGVTDYEDRAVAFGSDIERLRALKAGIAAAVPTSRLFDSARFARHLERAYEVMMERARTGQPHRSFDVAPIET